MVGLSNVCGPKFWVKLILSNTCGSFEFNIMTARLYVIIMLSWSIYISDKKKKFKKNEKMKKQKQKKWNKIKK